MFGIVLQLLELRRRNGGNERVRIVGRPGGHREDVAVVRIDDDDRAALRFRFERFLRQFLQMQIERGDDGVVPARAASTILSDVLRPSWSNVILYSPCLPVSTC